MSLSTSVLHSALRRLNSRAVEAARVLPRYHDERTSLSTYEGMDNFTSANGLPKPWISFEARRIFDLGNIRSPDGYPLEWDHPYSVTHRMVCVAAK